ncbi:ABC transporter ATP-binding protein [Pseudobacter ginsenosidimutans]|uniref:ABC-2 type transport system ATP-binding protein n=1 Tax=Pseudobacter ginsenosidimutans TaxID=661488 RepID=A0A4Q7MG32_9BACT|nr:ABC transporter ATP-binding protein [Pseudobacter ginsenosidimutans]QEC45599.1 ABC transporter ATP-binding protein [Pseudobacter ginsenosidimutans]RZS67146.1 ABC-2 type transport system ATP-binding protein [Pseudobacter ginsenosidimutans]
MILRTERLSHKYSSNWAIRDINIQIGDAGIIGLLGSNGAGKSTTMNIICGALNQTEGKVFINDIDMGKYPKEAKKEIGFLPQTPPLYTDLTIDEYLVFSAELRKINKHLIRSAVDEAKERCGIQHFSSRLIKNLSGGYRQRVGIAQAIIHKPSLVVLDEPTNGLDPNQLIEARKLIREIAEEHTVLLSSHILSEINILCREIIMIESGRVVFSDSMDAFNNYAQSHALLIRMGNPPPREELMNVPGVSKVEFVTNEQLKIYFEGNADELTERLIATSVSAGWKIKEINPDKGLLDDIFKQLSDKVSR